MNKQEDLIFKIPLESKRQRRATKFVVAIRNLIEKKDFSGFQLSASGTRLYVDSRSKKGNDVDNYICIQENSQNSKAATCVNVALAIECNLTVSRSKDHLIIRIFSDNPRQLRVLETTLSL